MSELPKGRRRAAIGAQKILGLVPKNTMKSLSSRAWSVFHESGNSRAIVDSSLFIRIFDFCLVI